MKLICKIVVVLGLLGIHPCLKAQSLSSSETTGNSTNAINIEFNKNIEFLGYVLHIGEPEAEPVQPSTQPLRILLDQKRMKLNGEESLHKMFELGANLDYSFFVELFTRMDKWSNSDEVHIPDDFLPKTAVDIDLIHEIIEQAKIFHRISEFDQFWKSSQPWYEKALIEINTIKPEDKWIETMEQFYQQQFREYKIIPSLTFWSGPGFGFSAEDENGTTAYFVLGPLRDDFRFDLNDPMTSLTIHEFGHSFVNHLLETTSADLIEETTPLFEPISASMSAQGYPVWSYAINEHFVRAGEVLIPELLNDTAMSESTLELYTEERSFIYLPFIVERLRTYRIREALSYELSIRNTMIDLKNEYLP